MATITKRVDKGVSSSKRYQYWKSSENADDATAIAAGDIFLIEESLGRPANYIYIETIAGTDLVIRLNGRITVYPPRDARLNWPTQPDLESPSVKQDSSMAAVDVGANEVWEFQNVLPICDLEIVTWTAGSFEIFVS